MGKERRGRENFIAKGGWCGGFCGGLRLVAAACVWAWVLARSCLRLGRAGQGRAGQGRAGQGRVARLLTKRPKKESVWKRAGALPWYLEG